MRQVFDWKFFIALGFALLSGYLAFAGYAAIEDGREKDRQNAGLIRINDSLLGSIERDRVADETERATAAANQAALLNYTKAVADKQRGLLEWLRNNGIDIPVRYVTEIPAPKVVTESTSNTPKAKQRRTTKRAPVDLPGKSERRNRKGKP
ncbi:MAG TPA: hypothetical protein VLI04_01580 [Nocardioidaceae bacterium]|nr:hypothetical protein [Nocardioidaceae bacterium]